MNFDNLSKANKKDKEVVWPEIERFCSTIFSNSQNSTSKECYWSSKCQKKKCLFWLSIELNKWHSIPLFLFQQTDVFHVNTKTNNKSTSNDMWLNANWGRKNGRMQCTFTQRQNIWKHNFNFCIGSNIPDCHDILVSTILFTRQRKITTVIDPRNTHYALNLRRHFIG